MLGNMLSLNKSSFLSPSHKEFLHKMYFILCISFDPYILGNLKKNKKKIKHEIKYKVLQSTNVFPFQYSSLCMQEKHDLC